jgi:hypothetical protein
MSQIDRVLEIAAGFARVQASKAARQTDRVLTGLALKLVAGLLLLAAAVVLLISMYMALARVVAPAGAMAIVGGVVALLGLMVLILGMSHGRKGSS